MEIGRYLQLLNRRKWVVALALITALLAVGLGIDKMTPVYSASAMVRIAEGRGGTVSYTELNYAERLINTSTQLLKSRPFLENVIRQLNLQDQPEALSRRIKVEALANTELIKITAEAGNPAESARIANALAALLVDQRDQIYAGQGAGTSAVLSQQLAVAEKQLNDARASLAQISSPQPDATPSPENSAAVADLAARIKFQEQTYAALLSDYDRARIDEATRGNSISITETAVAPSLPSRPVPQLYWALALVVGLVAGVGLAFLFDRLDTTIHSVADLETIPQVPLLGAVPNFHRRRNGEKGAVLLNLAEGSTAAEAFRFLGTNILPLLSASSHRSSARAKTLLIASADLGSGRSTVTANLAVAIAGMGRTVAVVDADAGQPSLHRAFKLSESASKSEDPRLNHPLEDKIVWDTMIPGVTVLTGRSWATSCPPPLNSWKAQVLIERLAENVDLLLLDSPPMLVSADAAILAP
ncbi:MAG TPA: P-loop NTPase, partial [Chloroflexota bacterium]|nr:P-loop NTPase [Chloroflexota bacterium]